MASVEHDAEIKAETSLISETERWYKVIAERYVHQALTVNPEIFENSVKRHICDAKSL